VRALMLALSCDMTRCFLLQTIKLFLLIWSNSGVGAILKERGSRSGLDKNLALAPTPCSGRKQRSDLFGLRVELQ